MESVGVGVGVGVCRTCRDAVLACLVLVPLARAEAQLCVNPSRCGSHHLSAFSLFPLRLSRLCRVFFSFPFICDYRDLRFLLLECARCALSVRVVVLFLFLLLFAALFLFDLLS